jgi:hypothetical protein
MGCTTTKSNTNEQTALCIKKYEEILKNINIRKL